MCAFRRLGVMIVDDNPSVRALISAVLRGLGLSDIREAGDGADALSQLAQEPADLVFLDLMMPGVPGCDVLRTLKGADSPAPDAQVLIVSGYGNEARAESAGADGWLGKPLTAASLAERVQTLLARRALAE
jgi:two-component system chemotaxis response regulator CheY